MTRWREPRARGPSAAGRRGQAAREPRGGRGAPPPSQAREGARAAKGRPGKRRGQGRHAPGWRCRAPGWGRRAQRGREPEQGRPGGHRGRWTQGVFHVKHPMSPRMRRRHPRKQRSQSAFHVKHRGDAGGLGGAKTRQGCSRKRRIRRMFHVKHRRSATETRREPERSRPQMARDRRGCPRGAPASPRCP